MQASITLAGLDSIRRGLQAAPEMARQELLAAMTESVNLLESDIVGNFPTHTGLTRSSIAGEAFVQEAGVLGVVSSPQPLVSWIEFGTRPHGISIEGQEAVAEWAKSKLGLGEEDAKSLAYGYAQKVRRHGTPANPVMQESLQRNLPTIGNIFDAAAGRIAAKLLGNGGLA